MKKIVFLGFRPYLGSVLFQLKNTSFLNENEIFIVFAHSQQKSIIGLVKKAIKKHNRKRALREGIIKINNLLFEKPIMKSLQILFPEKELTFLNEMRNATFLPYKGVRGIDNLKDYDLMIVASYGQRIPADIFNAPKERTFNIHPSYLPNLRGGYPTYVEAYHGKETSGTTIHYMEKGWDDGDIISREEYKVDVCANNSERMELSAVSAANQLNRLHTNNYSFDPIAQDGSKVTYCHKTLKYRLFVGDIENNLEGYVRANYNAALFPFTYGFYKGFIVSILQMKQLISERPNKRKYEFFKDKGKLYLKHRGRLFEIEKYIYKGKLFGHTNNIPQSKS